MDVDAAAFEAAARLFGQDLHVAREHGQLGAARRDHVEEPRLLRLLVAALDRQVVVGDAVPLDEAAHVVVVRGDSRDVDRHLAGLPLVQEVVEAVAVARDDQERLDALRRDVQADRHVEAPRHRRQRDLEIGARREARADGAKDRAHEEEAGLRVAVVRRLGDEGIARRQRRGDGGDDADLVAAADGEDERTAKPSGADATASGARPLPPVHGAGATGARGRAMRHARARENRP